MNICIVCGARPNFIKVAPVIRAIEAAQGQGKDVDFKLVFTGAADDPTLENGLFDDLQVRRPDVCLGVTCVNLNELTGQVMSAFENYLRQNPTDTVIVVDDLASTMATAIVTKKQGLRLVHLAAGTRSFDIRMPKEINRLVIDGLSDILFTAGMSNNSIANREGAELSKVYMVGNVLIDNLRFNRNRLVRSAVFDALGLEESGTWCSRSIAKHSSRTRKTSGKCWSRWPETTTACPSCTPAGTGQECRGRVSGAYGDSRIDLGRPDALSRVLVSHRTCRRYHYRFG
jgi:UDP-N-acetylglucosamine 2-epimerase (non-hydrolysing)